MTPQNLLDYVKVYKNHLTLDLCKNVVKKLSDVNWKKHTYHDETKNEVLQYDNDLSVCHANFNEAQEVHKQIWFAIERYILKDFKDFEPWFNGWNGYQQVRFNKYDVSTEMRIHCDHIHTLFDGNRRGIPVLTVLGALNDDYEGGEFVMFEDYEIKMPAGSVIVFPSNFMFPHEVRPIKSGIRYSYVSWTW
jgi:predicted 2-oxoglutarate/Fe(II)-dependent dioxygenase YbiX